MNFLTDVKTERFKCIQCREYAKIVVLEDIELAWCETFECTNTSTMIKKGNKWVEHAHEDIYDIDIIQGMMLKSFMAKASLGQDDEAKSPLPHSPLRLLKSD
jgi:hypothetical protein